MKVEISTSQENQVSWICIILIFFAYYAFHVGISTFSLKLMTISMVGWINWYEDSTMYIIIALKKIQSHYNQRNSHVAITLSVSGTSISDVQSTTVPQIF